MLNAISKYIIVTLLTICLGTGGYAYMQHQKNIELALDVMTYKAAAEVSLKAKEDADASCLITVESLNAHYKAQEELENLQKDVGDAILTLPNLTLKEKVNEAAKAPQTPADDDRLSPDLMRLLDAAYCYGDKDGCAAPAE